MNKELLNNIKKVYSKIDSNEIKFNLILSGSDTSNQVSLTPYFRKDDIDSSTITTDLGFYILVNSIKSLFKSINYHIAGKICENNSLLAPTILNYYTSAFHNLESILALNGIMYFIPTATIDNDKKTVDLKKQTLVRYSKNNKWKIESSKIGHTNRWLELSRIYTNETNTPDTFLILFDYLFGASFQNNLVDKYEHYKWFSNKQKIYYKDNIYAFYKLIPKTRHMSAYNSLGSDVQVIDAVVNGDSISNEAISKHAKMFGVFSNSFLNLCLDEIIAIIQNIDMKKNSKKAILQAIYLDYFDKVEFTQLDYHLLKKYKIIEDAINIRVSNIE